MFTPRFDRVIFVSTRTGPLSFGLRACMTAYYGLSPCPARSLPPRPPCPLTLSAAFSLARALPFSARHWTGGLLASYYQYQYQHQHHHQVPAPAPPSNLSFKDESMIFLLLSPPPPLSTPSLHPGMARAVVIDDRVSACCSPEQLEHGSGGRHRRLVSKCLRDT